MIFLRECSFYFDELFLRRIKKSKENDC